METTRLSFRSAEVRVALIALFVLLVLTAVIFAVQHPTFLPQLFQHAQAYHSQLLQHVHASQPSHLADGGDYQSRRP